MQNAIAPSFSVSSTSYALAPIKVKTVVSNDTAALKSVAPVIATTVVQNDTSVAVKTTMPVFAAIEQMVAEHEVWHNGAFRTSNEQLYLLLQKCYALYKGMEGNSKDAEEKRKGLEDYINLKAIRVQGETHTLNKIVKCVFGVDRRRASAYALALRVASNAKTTVENLPTFIRNAGGVEEVRRSAAKKDGTTITTHQKNIAVANEAVTQKSIAVITSEQLGMTLDAGKIGKNVVLIGTWQADGSVVVRAVVQNDTALNSALAGYYSANKETVKAKATENIAANDTTIMRLAIAEAAAA
jgi:hypothetical protein